jgi:hypothetical protein
LKIKTHSESHIVELDDGSEWSIFPGDLDVTLNWQPDADLKLVRINDELSSHALISAEDNSPCAGQTCEPELAGERSENAVEGRLEDGRHRPTTSTSMSSSQLKRAERAIQATRDQARLPPEAAEALQELVDAVRTIGSRLTTIEHQGRPSSTKQTDLPDPIRRSDG